VSHRSTLRLAHLALSAVALTLMIAPAARADDQPPPPMPAHGGSALPPGHPSLGMPPQGMPGMPGMEPAPATAPVADAEGRFHARGLTVALPAGWTSETPSSGMRLLQASIPGAKGAAQLVVFNFGPGQGGDAESNIARWISQVDTAPGTTPERQSFSVTSPKGPFDVSTVSVPGTLKPTGMGTGGQEPQPNGRLLGAVVSGTGGPWFFKITGPDETVKAGRDGFVAMLKGLRPD